MRELLSFVLSEKKKEFFPPQFVFLFYFFLAHSFGRLSGHDSFHLVWFYFGYLFGWFIIYFSRFHDDGGLCAPFFLDVQTISHDLLELLEKLQTSRLDDQRCVLPAYFTQVKMTFIHTFTGWLRISPFPSFSILTLMLHPPFARSIFFFNLGQLFKNEYAPMPEIAPWFFSSSSDSMFVFVCVCVCVCKSDTFFIFLSVKRGDIPCLALICFSRSLAISYILFLWPSRAHCLLEGDEGNRSWQAFSRHHTAYKRITWKREGGKTYTWDVGKEKKKKRRGNGTMISNCLSNASGCLPFSLSLSLFCFCPDWWLFLKFEFLVFE